jgi:CheY-like chemotaxis protein
VLRNLISNSLKFTGSQGAVIVRAEYIPDGLPYAVIPQAPWLLLDNARAGAVRITVVDDGAGLSPAQVGDICKEGVQFNVNTLQAGGGSGLGLFIGKGIVEQQGGTMHVSSEGLGKGATFEIELPLFYIEGEVVQDPLSPIASPRRPHDLGDAQDSEAPLVPIIKYVLVVDDALFNRKMLMRILKVKGYVCSEAADGQQALDVYRQMRADGTPPSAVLIGGCAFAAY